MKDRIACLLGLVLLGVVLGCGRTEQIGADIEEPHAVVDQAIADLEQVQQQSGTAAMLTEGLARLAAMPDQAQQEMLLHWLIQHPDLLEEVEPLLVFFSALVETNEELALAAYSGMAYRMMAQEPEQWLALLLDPAAPLSIRARGLQAWIRAYGASAPVALLAGQLDAVLDPAMLAYAPQLFQELVREVSKNEDPDHVAEVLAVLAVRVEEHEGLLLPVRVGQAHLLLRQEAWDDAFAHVRTYRDLLGEREISYLLTQLLRAGAAHDPSLVETITDWAYTTEPEMPHVRERVARWHMDQLRAAPDSERLVAVIERALGHGVPARALAAPFLWGHFYPLMSVSDEAGRRQVQGLLFRIRSETDEDAPSSLRTGLATAALDSCFFLEDFAQALEIVAAGIEGHDDDWHLEVREKIEAHLALQEGRPEDAIERFERHIERVRVWSEPVVAPDTGRKVVADEVIALNERRIGDIRAGMDGGEEAATAAYARAARHYRAALDAYQEDPVSRELVQQALDRLPVQSEPVGAGGPDAP